MIQRSVFAKGEYTSAPTSTDGISDRVENDLGKLFRKYSNVVCTRLKCRPAWSIPSVKVPQRQVKHHIKPNQGGTRPKEGLLGSHFKRFGEKETDQKR